MSLVNPLTEKKREFALRCCQLKEAGRPCKTHWYSMNVIFAPEGTLSNLREMEFENARAVSPVGAGSPPVVPVTPTGVAEVCPALTPRTQTVWMLPVFKPLRTWARSSALPFGGESWSVTRLHVISAGSVVCVPMRYAYSWLSTDTPAANVQVTPSSPSPPDRTLGVMLGIRVLTVTDAASDAPTSPVYSIRTWNWYAVAASRLVILTCVSLCASPSESIAESATEVQGAPPVAVVKSPPLAVFL